MVGEQADARLVEFYEPALWLGMTNTHPGNGSKAGLVKRAPSGWSRVFRDRSGALLKVYDLDDIEDRGRTYLLVLRNQMTGSRVRVLVGKTRLAQGKIRLADFQDAPSIVVHEFEQGASHIRLDFVCVRLGKVARVKLRAAR